MTIALVICCDSYWDEGRMPCRGHLPLTRITDHDGTREAIAAAGWTMTLDGKARCPAHTRIAREGS